MEGERFERGKRKRTRTRTPRFHASGCAVGLGVLLLWIRVTGFDLLLNCCWTKTHLNLVLFWMNTVLEQTSPCAAFLKNAPFPFLHLFTPSAVYHLLQEALLLPDFFFLSRLFSVVSFIISFFTFSPPSPFVRLSFLSLLPRGILKVCFFRCEYFLQESPFQPPFVSQKFLFTIFFLADVAFGCRYSTFLPFVLF